MCNKRIQRVDRKLNCYFAFDKNPKIVSRTKKKKIDIQKIVLANLRFLQHKWNDGLTRPWIILKFVAIVLMLAKCPNGHLIESGKSEQVSWNALRHYGERDPGADFIRVIRARNKAV